MARYDCYGVDGCLGLRLMCDAVSGKLNISSVHDKLFVFRFFWPRSFKMSWLVNGLAVWLPVCPFKWLVFSLLVTPRLPARKVRYPPKTASVGVLCHYSIFKLHGITAVTESLIDTGVSVMLKRHASRNRPVITQAFRPSS